MNQTNENPPIAPSIDQADRQINPFLKLKAWIDKGLELFVGLLMAALVSAVSWQVLTRYLTSTPSSSTSEIASFLLIWIGLLGAAIGFKNRAHVGIDVLVIRLSGPQRQLIERLAMGFVCLFAFGVLVVGGSQLVVRQLAGGQLSPSLQISMGYIYLALPISGIYISLTALEFMVWGSQSSQPDSQSETLETTEEN